MSVNKFVEAVAPDWQNAVQMLRAAGYINPPQIIEDLAAAYTTAMRQRDTLLAALRRDHVAYNQVEDECDRMRAALAPLLAIAKAYYNNELDEGRPTSDRPVEQIELVATGGGRRLLTVADCLVAKEAIHTITSKDTTNAT